MADITEAIRRLIFEYVSKGADQVMQTQEAVAASTTKTDKASLSLEKSFGNLERRYVETVRHQQDYAKVQEKVNAAVAQNPGLQERANAVLAAASQHFDKLAFAAEKGGFASTLLGKAMNTMLGPAGLLGAAMTGVGIAVGYMAEKFISSSRTIEQALEEQTRLVKDAKTWVDAKATAEERANAIPPNAARLLALENEIALNIKLAEAIQKTTEAALKKATVPTQVAGEMGEAPTGFAPAGGPNAAAYQQMVAAVQALNAAHAQGLPGVQAYMDELGRIGLAYPELQKTTAEMVRLQVANLGLEQGALAARAYADGLAGVATNAQLAAAGLVSIEHFGVMMEQSGRAAAALAAELHNIMAAHPGISQGFAKQLQLLEAQLAVAQARTEEEKRIAQEALRIIQLRHQNLTIEEAQLQVAKERQIAEAKIASTMESSVYYSKNQTDATNATAASYRTVSGHVQNVEHSISRSVDLTNQWADTMNGIVWTKSLLDTDLYDNVFGGAKGPTGDIQTSFFPTPYLENVNWAKRVQFTDSGGGRAAITRHEEIMASHESALKGLTSSTDSLNATMQNALSPFYSQDPRTTKLGFRAGVVGNPDWQTGATNANPLVAVLGAGATAPGMADGGSFTVGGGYSATDNRMALFPVASGEEIVVNRNKEGGGGGQVVNIDNRIIITGSVDDDALSKMKVSRYQQAQRMRAGLAQV